MNKLTNEELATTYFQMASAYMADLSKCTQIMKQIENAEPISESFQEHNNLNQLPFGQKTKRYLELILTKGPERARKEIYKQKENWLRDLQDERYTACDVKPDEDKLPEVTYYDKYSYLSLFQKLTRRSP
jgi:hypothetical protein